MIKNAFVQLYRIWVYLCFIVVFLLLYPFFVLFIQRESWKKYGHFLNKLWAYMVFGSCGLPTKIIYQFKPKGKDQYVYCANHSSYLDIPTLCYALPGYFVLIGKASLAKVPLFGYMFRNLYISVDRSNAKSRADSIKKSMETIDKGRSLAVFPEGTIPQTDQAPHMGLFKDGAFRVAIEKQVPIVPVSIVSNWKILPDDGKFIPRLHKMVVVICLPIQTKGLTMDQLNDLKKETYDTIDKELKRYNPHLA